MLLFLTTNMAALTSLANRQYFGWPNQPSSGTMKIYIEHIFIYSERHICVITEIRKVKMIDNVKK